jgi:hypothetical protein
MAGAKQWVRELPAGVIQVKLVRSASSMIVATRDQLLRRVSVQTQEITSELSVGQPILGFALSGNERRLALATGAEQLLLYSMDNDLHLRNQLFLAGLAQVFFSPLSADGRFIVVRSHSQGLIELDNRTLAPTTDIPGALAAVALADDGRCVLVSASETVALYGLARPDLHASLVPLGDLRQGRFTRLRIVLTNTGQRTARRIRVELSGHLECPPASFAADLAPGMEIASENQSLHPTAEGMLPVQVKITFVDDLDIPHLCESVELITVAADD